MRILQCASTRSQTCGTASSSPLTEMAEEAPADNFAGEPPRFSWKSSHLRLQMTAAAPQRSAKSGVSMETPTPPPSVPSTCTYTRAEPEFPERACCAVTAIQAELAVSNTAQRSTVHPCREKNRWRFIIPACTPAESHRRTLSRRPCRRPSPRTRDGMDPPADAQTVALSYPSALAPRAAAPADMSSSPSYTPECRVAAPWPSIP